MSFHKTLLRFLSLILALIAFAVPVGAAEVGNDDFQVSSVGVEDFIIFATAVCQKPSVAYNSDADEYLIVWCADDATVGEFEIYGQRLDATGAAVGGTFPVSHMGPDGSSQYLGLAPDVVYNGDAQEYFVVWWGEDDTAPLVNEEYEVFGQRLDGATGDLEGDPIRITHIGTDGDIAYGPGAIIGSPTFTPPAVAFDPVNAQYVVVWSGDTTIPGEYEIFGQRVAAAGSLNGGKIQISQVGPDDDTGFGALAPDIVYNQANGEMLVVWMADDNTGALVNNEFEVYAQRVNSTLWGQVGSVIRISEMGADGDTFSGVDRPSVAYDPDLERYLVVWRGVQILPSAPTYEVFGEILDSQGAVVKNDFLVSDMGTSVTETAALPSKATAVYNTVNHEYLVVWYGDDGIAPLVDNEFEIFVQRLDGEGSEIGDNDARISAVGGTGATGRDCTLPVAAYAPAHNEYLVVWWADEGVDNHYHILGQRLADAVCGNGFLEAGEGCEDGGVLSGDGCDASCQVETAAGDPAVPGDIPDDPSGPADGSEGGDGPSGGEESAAEQGGGCSLVR